MSLTRAFPGSHLFIFIIIPQEGRIVPTAKVSRFKKHAETLSRVSGKTVRVTEVSPEIFDTKPEVDGWWLQFT
jgi:hypothetical protein